MSLGKETRWKFEWNLNLSSIANLKKDILYVFFNTSNKHIQLNSFIFFFLGDETYGWHIFFAWIAAIWGEHLAASNKPSSLAGSPWEIHQKQIGGFLCMVQFLVRNTCQMFRLRVGNPREPWIFQGSILHFYHGGLFEKIPRVTIIPLWLPLGLWGDDYAERHQKWSWDPSLYQTASDRFLYPQEGDAWRWPMEWWLCWSVFNDSGIQNRNHKECLQMFTSASFLEFSSISDCVSKFCNSVGPSKR